MRKDIKRQEHLIDAKGKVVGRLAGEIAILLRGKEKPEFLPHEDRGGFVKVKNVDQMMFSGKKLDQKKYYHHSGYLGGLKTTSLRKVFEKEPGQVLKRAVFGMLPKNKLRSQQIKRLIIVNN